MGFIQDFAPRTARAATVANAPSAPSTRGFLNDFGPAHQSVADSYIAAPTAPEPEPFETAFPARRTAVWEQPIESPPTSGGSLQSFPSRPPSTPLRSPVRASPLERRQNTAPSVSSDLSGLHSRIGQLNREVGMASSGIDSAAHRAERLQRDYDQTQDKLRSAIDRLETLKDTESRTEDDLRSQSRTLKRLEKKLQASMGWGSDYPGSSSSLNYELSNLDLSYKNGVLTPDSRWRLSDYVDARRNRIQNLSTSLSGTREARRACEQEIRSLQARLDELESQKSQAVRTTESSQRKKAVLERELQRLQDRHYDSVGSFY